MRRVFVSLLSVSVLSQPALAETLEELLASRALESVVHPIAAQFLAEEGAALLPEAQMAQATAQAKIALQRQTSPIVLMIRGAGGAMNTPAAQRMREQAQQASRGGIAGGLLRSAVGLGPGANSAPAVDPDQMQREIDEAMAEPWVRGIGAARAMAGLGDAQAAASFYVACLEMVDAEWVPEACLEDIIALGPRRAQVLLLWMLDNADTVSFVPGGLQLPTDLGDVDDADGPSQSAVQLRNAALEGLGALIGSGMLPAAEREQAFAKLVGYASGRANEPYLRGVAEGLARSVDPRAVPLLETLSERRNSLDARQAAQRGLAVGFGDRDAIERLRRDLGDRDLEVQLRAAQSLYEIGDAAAFEWAVDVIAERRTSASNAPDVRAQVVRDLVELGGQASAGALRAALDEGIRNDWVAAWVRVGLLELGDTSVLPDVEAALAIADWDLDPRGMRTIWRAIKPWLKYTTQLAMSGGLSAMSSTDQLREVTSLIGNAVASQRGRALQGLAEREALTAQLRWQTADALATVQPPEAIGILTRLLDDPTPGVGSAVALALARLDDPEVTGLLGGLYDTALADASTLGYAPELRATLVRSAALNAPAAPETAALLARAGSDPDAGVRLIALAAAARR